MNLFTSQNPNSWFTQNIEMENHEKVGMVTLIGGEMKRSRAEEIETLKSRRSEEERLATLKSWFDIELEENEKEGIKGLSTELKS